MSHNASSRPPEPDHSTGSSPRGPLVLVVRDGWGRNPHPEHNAFNAIHLADTPVGDRLLEHYPWTLIHTSGEDVGLPEGTMGNSEVGHQNLGAGRIVFQESVRITRAVRDQSFYDNVALVRAVKDARKRGGSLHLLGLASDAGVHGMLTHLYACLELCRRLEFRQVFLHLFTDGRDTGPFTGIEFIRRIEAKTIELGVGQIASLCGRYFAMDRDNRWDRVQRAYDCLTGRQEVPHFTQPTDALQDAYDHPVAPNLQGDEFVEPRTIGSHPDRSRIQNGDSVIFYNYRGDRPREITKAFVLDDFYGSMPPAQGNGERGFDRGERLDLTYVTMTAYEESLNRWLEVAFPKAAPMPEIGGMFLAEHGWRQFRCAETEKFPHVTFFFNDYREEPFPGETRRMAQSPQVATYDLQPEMSAREVCDAVLERLAEGDPQCFILVNFANTDMVGHTGNLDAAIRAAEVVDGLVGEIVDTTLAQGGRLIVTADHGNSEQMWNPETGSPHTAHTTYDVECILVDPRLAPLATGSALVPAPALHTDGKLADVFPTLLSLVGLEPPAAMSGISLLLEGPRRRLSLESSRE
ncbi:MAG: 2,3-bisphosphoglycerate-independent phosphoglycerate mutase [Thermoanaerobaculia bacterium]|nr:2,3-bisphosphoglycerate-independent phosphoglycerate mutase [Thermoanaerobaculia bacterium]